MMKESSLEKFVGWLLMQLKSKQVFKDSELQSIHFHDTIEDVNSLGLIVIHKHFVKFGLDKNLIYVFLHLTLREYLLAI